MRSPRSRVDGNQPEIVAALRKAGATVQHLHMVGRGCPDLLVGYKNNTWLYEVKQLGESLTPMELEWLQTWQGGEARVVYSAEDALKIIGATEA